MKRKRKSNSDDREAKRRKNETELKDPPTWPLLRQYYPQVLTLRQHLASKLSNKRRRKVLQYGHNARDVPDSDADTAVATLLDNTVVGCHKGPIPSKDEPFDRDLTVFTQQLSNSTAARSSTQLALNQSEVSSTKCSFSLSVL